MRALGISLALGLIVTSMGLRAGWTQTDSPPEALSVPDAALRTVLEDSLGLSAGATITAAELAKLTALENPGLPLPGRAWPTPFAPDGRKLLGDLTPPCWKTLAASNQYRHHTIHGGDA